MGCVEHQEQPDLQALQDVMDCQDHRVLQDQLPKRFSVALETVPT